MLMKFESLVALVATGVLLTSCSNSEQETTVRTPNIAYIANPNSNGVYANNDKLLNKWLKEHVGRRVISFTGLEYGRGGVQGYQLITLQGTNAGERFDEVAVPSSESQNTPSIELQAWVDENPDRKLVGFTAIPKENGGAQAYILCSDQKQ